MRASKLVLLGLALAAAPPASAQVGAGAGFDRMWTGWAGASRESQRVESEAALRARQDVAAATPERLQALRDRGVALGERVGEIVRLGDCEDGERVARQAGDFALVDAVRDHCRGAQPAVANSSDHTRSPE